MVGGGPSMLTRISHRADAARASACATTPGGAKDQTKIPAAALRRHGRRAPIRWRRAPPCLLRRAGGENSGSGCARSGAQSLRASATSTKPARSVSDGCPVKLPIVSISSRSEGPAASPLPRKCRAISCATLRRCGPPATESEPAECRNTSESASRISSACAGPRLSKTDCDVASGMRLLAPPAWLLV